MHRQIYTSAQPSGNNYGEFNMELGLQGKKVLVTGATRGIGFAIAQTFAQQGCRVAFCARNAEKVDETVTALEEYGILVYGAAIDVTDKAALAAWMAEAARLMGGIDILVANPSSLGMGISEQDWQNGYELDLMGTVHTMQIAEPYLEKSATETGGASMLVISSAAIAEADTESAYGAYKAALIYHAKGAARRLAQKNIRVNVISPGTIYSEDGFWGNVKQHMPQVYDGYLKRNLLGRMGTPVEIANVAAFLSSPGASFVTGANLLVDGGLTSRVNY